MQLPNLSVPDQFGVSLYIPGDVIVRESKNCFLKNLIITKIGYYGNSYGHFIRRNNINEYVLLYCVNGKGWVETGSTRTDVRIGDLVFCDINKPHAYGADNKDPWHIHWVHFTGAGVPEMYELLNISPQSAVLQVGIEPKLVDLMNKAYNILLSGYSLPNLISSATCLQELFCYLINGRMYSVLQGCKGTDVQHVIDMMVINIHENYTLEQLANCISMSKYHFVRRFKESTGYSPVEYFNRLKIQKACELLDTSSLNIKEISEYLSYGNSFYFSEVFKRIIGQSPKNYRTQQKPFK